MTTLVNNNETSSTIPRIPLIIKNNSKPNLGDSLELEKYVYHSVRGFNIQKLISILAMGILSKEESLRKGVFILSEGLGLNGDQYVSLSTYEVLDRKCYSGKDLGVIVEAAGLNFKTFTREEAEKTPFFEKQVFGRIPREKIVGITVPPSYMDESFLDSQIFYIPVTNDVKQGMDSLEKCYLQTLGISLLADSVLNAAYKQALSLPDDVDHIKKTHSFLDAFSKVDKLKDERQSEFNSALMGRIKMVYKEVMKKDKLTLVDMIRFHTDNALPIYLTTGKLAI